MSKVQKAPFRCPICMELPEGKIFLCKNGHSICHRCSTQLQRCPKCRVPFGEENRIRNLDLEELIGEMEIPCSNREHGCSAEIPRKELSAHLSSCSFSPTGICKLLGKKCDFSTRNPSELFQHVVEKHGSITTMAAVTSHCGNLAGILSAMRARKDIDKETTMGVLGVEISSTCKVLEIIVVNMGKGEFSVFYIHFAEKEEEDCPFEVTLKLEAPAKKTCLSWTRQPLHYKKLEEGINDPPIKIPIPFLLEYFEEPGVETNLYWEFTPKNKNNNDNPST